MKKFKKFLAILLVASMIFTTNAVNVFAEGSKANQEEQLNEETVETNEESVGAKLGEPEVEAEEEAEETTVGDELSEPEEDTDIDENLSEPALDEEEPEEDTRRGERLSEPALEEESELELELDKKKKDDQLYGADLHKFILVGKDNDDEGTTIKYTVDETIGGYGPWGQGWNNSGLVTGGEKHGKRGFYIIDQGDKLNEDTVMSAWDENHAIDPDPDAPYNVFVQNKFEAWLASPTYDIAIGYLFGDEPTPPSTDHGFYIVYYGSDADFAYPPFIGTLSYDVVESADYFVPEGEWFIKYSTECLYEDGFIKVDKSLEETLNSGYDRNTFPTPKGTGLHPGDVRDAYNDWVTAGKTEDVVYGVLYCSYFYVSYLKNDGTIEMKKLRFTDEIELGNLVDSDIWVATPDGKNLKGFQYWFPDDYSNYDFTDAGEVNFYKNLTEDESKLLLYPDDVHKIKATFDIWKDHDFNPQYHYGAIYDDGEYAVSMTVKENPEKVKYNVGEKFDPTGLIVNVTYSDGNTVEVWYEDVEDMMVFSPSLNAALTAGTTKVKVTYEGVSTYINITVSGGSNPSGGSSSSSGSSSGGGSSDPTHGPMGDLTKNPLYANALNNIAVNTANNIPQTSLLNNSGLYVQLKSMQENANTSFNNAKDSFGNVGYGQWLRVPNTTTWYFYSGDLNQATNGQTQGFLSNGWFNLGWDGQDRWYHFDGSGVMQLGWYQEAGKTYFLQNDLNDNWYGKAVTGTQNIGGRIYNFDANGALIN